MRSIRTHLLFNILTSGVDRGGQSFTVRLDVADAVTECRRRARP